MNLRQGAEVFPDHLVGWSGGSGRFATYWLPDVEMWAVLTGRARQQAGTAQAPLLELLWARSAENPWITSSSSASVICAAFYRAIFNTIMTPERIFRSARTARDLVPYNLPRPAISLPSRKLAVCTTAMSVEPLSLHFPARTPSNSRHVNFEV
jgi:hypothetical protein